jgi:CheY-like chemotaxis protein
MVTDPVTEPRPRILIVEDDYLISMASELALSDAGFEVIGSATSGEAALETAAYEEPDLVVMDVRLAGQMDGVEAASVLLQQGIRCIFASANSDPETLNRGAKAEPLGWLRKPFTDAELVQAVRKALDALRTSPATQKDTEAR